MNTQAPALIVMIPLLFAVLTPLIGFWRKELCYPWVLIAVIISFSSSLVTLGQVVLHGTIRYKLGGWAAPYGIEYLVDPLSAMMAVVVAGTALFTAFYSLRSLEFEMPGKVVYYYTLYLLQVAGLAGMVVTGDVFNLYVFLEITALTGYALLAAGQEKGLNYATFRYLILGTVGACFYLLGIGYLYMVTGSLNLIDLHALLPSLYGSKVVLVAFAFFMVGIAIKMGLFPMHFWLPDAYAKAPSVSSTLIGPLMTKVSVYIMLRIFFFLFEPSFTYGAISAKQILLWLGTAAIVYGAILALAQTDFKRMICFIIIMEIGYMAGGIGVGNTVAVRGVVLHILNDAIMTFGMFAVAGIIMYKTGSHNISDFRGLFRKTPITMAALVVVALSVIGVPPTCGFFSKWLLLSGAAANGNWVYVAALLFASLVSVVLFFRIFEAAYGFDRTSHHDTHDAAPVASVKISEAPMTMIVPTILVAVGIVVFGLYNQTIMKFIVDVAIPSL